MCLLVIIPLLVIMFTANSVIAPTDTYKARFRVAATGRCLVHYDVPPYSPSQIPPSEGDYMEWESTAGTFIFGGKALTEYGISEWYTGEHPSIEGDWYTTFPGTLEAKGQVKVSWAHEGINYAIEGKAYSRSTTHGLLEPDQDILWIKGSEGGMDFIGVRRVGSQTTPLQCGITFIVGPSPGSSVLVRLQIGPGWPCDVVTFYLYEEGFEYTLPDVTISVPSARAFVHQVIIM